MNKEKATEIIKKICKDNKRLSLRITKGTASWMLSPHEMTPNDWKNIGYVSALAFAFDIKELE